PGWPSSPPVCLADLIELRLGLALEIMPKHVMALVRDFQPPRYWGRSSVNLNQMTVTGCDGSNSPQSLVRSADIACSDGWPLARASASVNSPFRSAQGWSLVLAKGGPILVASDNNHTSDLTPTSPSRREAGRHIRTGELRSLLEFFGA